MARKRGERERDEDDQYSGLSIEFDDDIEEGLGDGAGSEAASGAVGPVRTAATELIATRPASRWSRIPVRYRVTAVLAALVLVTGSVVAVQLARAAGRRARERFTLAVVDDRYQPSISQVGLNMALTLVDNGPAPVTVVFLQVSQPGLSLAFYPVKIALTVGKPTPFTLVGVFDCQRTTPPGGSTVEVTVSGQNGISSVDLGLKAGSVPPKGWQNQRSTFCATANAGTGLVFAPTTA